MADVLHSGQSITGGHTNSVAGGAAGFMSGTDKTKLDGLPDAAGLATQISAALAAKVHAFGPWGCNGNPATTATRWMPRAMSGAVASNSTGTMFIVAPFAMTLVNITASYSNAIQATDSLTYSVEIDGVNSALTVTLTPSTPVATGTHAGVSVNQGQALSIRVVQSGSAASTASCVVGVTLGYKS